MIPVFGSQVGQDELDEIADCFSRQWLGSGPKTAAFESAFAQRLGLSNLVVVNSGSGGLYVAAVLLDLPPGSDIIVPAYTWLACAQAVVLAGHRPVFCDVDLATGNVTAETIAAALTPETRAVMVVHYAGLPARMQPILDLGLPVIEDAAHAVDSRIGNRACGSFGDIGVYSFDAVKNLTMGEGGGITTRSLELAARARILRHSGIGSAGFEASIQGTGRWWEYDIKAVSQRLLVSDMNAAVGLVQLRRLDALQAERRRIWQIYQEQFSDLDWLVRPADADPGDRHSYFTYAIRIPNRDRSAQALYRQGIYTTLRYHPLHLNPIFKADVRLPNSERLNQEALSIPLHPNLSDDDVETVISAVRALPGTC
ncbi:MAG TPA: DegT/DnrJ/EryC1/StrS family aminotransferase [Xanthomonadales bacterium]|nr:DegT/DnrJ/EryC1/StrS family aminotransferase [Xanthomonadales bacterium]